jgi:hypothetical protein
MARHEAHGRARLLRQRALRRLHGRDPRRRAARAGVWLKSQPVADPAVAARYNCTDLFELKSKRFAEIGRVSMPGNR